jgi:hypothetical protein
MSATLAGAGRIAERRFYFGVSVAMVLAVLLGFSRSVFLRPLFPSWHSPSEPIFYVHGALFMAWCVLLVVQASLVGAGRTDVHRKLGWAGAALALAMVVLGVRAALVAARRPTGFVDTPVPPLQFLLVPIADMVLFPLFVAAAVLLRRDAQAHKRLMLLATVNLMAAAVGRWPVVYESGSPLVTFAIVNVFLVALGLWDWRTRGRLHPATLWGGALFVASQPLRIVLSTTPGWLALARWMTGLPG